MARTIPEGEPTTMAAGDTVEFTVSLADYAPADGYDLWYAVVGPSAFLGSPYQADVVDGQWVVTIPATASASITGAGTYRLTGWVSLGSERFTTFTGFVAVSANPETATQTQLLTHEERALAAIEAVLENRITADVEAYTLNGRAVTKIKTSDLLALKAHYKHLLWKRRNPGAPAPSRSVVFRAV